MDRPPSLRPGVPPVADLPPVLIVSPREADRSVLSAALAEINVPFLAPDPAATPPADLAQIGAVVLAHEAVTQDLLDRFAAALAQQEPWSELSVIVLTRASDNRAHIRKVLSGRWSRAKFLFLPRPVGHVEFQTAISVSLSGRLRQFALRDQLATERMLRRELNHRVKNILTIIQSIAMMTRRASGSSEEAFDRFLERLALLDRVHVVLQDRGRRSVGFRELTDLVLAPYGGRERIDVAGPAAPIEPRVAHVIGLCLQELATNSVKYGALGTDTGRITLTLARTGTGSTFRWIESGGAPVRPPERAGYGSRLLRGAFATLFGDEPELTFGKDGFALVASGPANILLDQEPGDTPGGGTSEGAGSRARRDSGAVDRDEEV